MTGRNVFVFPRHMTSWVELVPLAQAIAETGSETPIVILATAEMASKSSEIEKLGLQYVDAWSSISRELAKWPGLTAGLGRWIEAAIDGKDAAAGDFLPLALLRMQALKRRLDIEYGVFQKLFSQWTPAALLCPGDRELSPVPPMLRAARDAGVPVVLAATNLPYIEGVAITRAESRSFRCEGGAPLINRLAARRFPKQIARTAYGNLLFSPGWRIFALASRNMISENPWVQGGGLSDFVFQHNLSKTELYEALGCPPQKFVAVGDQTLDPLRAALDRRAEIRRELTLEHGLAPEKPLAVMAVPNEAEHNLATMEEHLARQEAFWSPLRLSGVEVLLCLHPKSKRDDYRALADRLGFHFANKRLHETLPAADLFLCSCSTTALWAKLCAVPIVNWDYLRLNLDYFREPHGVVEVHTAAEFAKVLPEVLAMSREPERSKIRAQAARIAKETIFDGKATMRICNFIHRVACGERFTGPVKTFEYGSEPARGLQAG